MSKFFEALERAEKEEALRRQASSPTITAGPPVRQLFKPPVVETPAAELASDRPNPVEERLVSLLTPSSFEAEQYRVLRHIVETMRQDAKLQIIAITSPGVGEGKSTTAINLAGALAQAPDARVLLADIDLRRPAVARQLGLEGSRRGFLEALVQSELTLADVVQRLPRFNLSVLPAGGGAVAPYEALKSPRLEKLLEEARQRYDYVVLDAPPYLVVPDCRLIAGYLDGILVVVAAHRTPRKELAEALHLMDPAKAVGLVFNCDDRPLATYYYNAYAGPSQRGSWWHDLRRGYLERRRQRQDSSGRRGTRDAQASAPGGAR